ncbi:hypothetical protein GGR54DRAFT_278615 [Hypoxylon sp. NC1633]|nr:hypothetical protein GGR54DRAFT_278615 [Hypoxylon sp. NC1633]
MALKYFTVLALAGSTFAQMSHMDHSAMMSSSASLASEATSNPMWTATDSTSTTPTPTDMTSSASAWTSSPSSDTMTDMASMDHGNGTMATMPLDTATGTGWMAPNATGAGETPLTGAGVTIGVSVGAFLVSTALATLVQL